MIVLYDDSAARNFEPFATTRPFGEMRAGAVLGRERWSIVLNAVPTSFVSGPHLKHFTEFDAPPAESALVLTPGTWVVNTRALPAPTSADVANCDAIVISGRVAAVRLVSSLPVASLADGTLTLDAIVSPESQTQTRTQTLNGVWIDSLWDVVRHLSQQLGADIPSYAEHLAIAPLEPSSSSTAPAIIGAHPVYVEDGAVIEPFTVCDTTAGPILIRHDATVHAFTRLVGPLYVGPHTSVSADRIAASAIGEHCRIHGEVSMTVVIGHANKGHEGFVGHSLIGRWVNLGAGTTTSNLKNSYGHVSMWTPHGVRNTDMQFVGTFFGDHAKTGIGLRLNTGSVVGAGANIMNAMPPKVVAPFSWGSGAPYAAFVSDKFLETATRVMQRRQVVLDQRQRENLELIMSYALANTQWPR